MRAMEAVSGEVLVQYLSGLDYPGFAYVQPAMKIDPADFLTIALSQAELQPRIVEALPWVILQYADLNWDQLIAEAVEHRFQDRLGYLVSVAIKVAKQHGRIVSVSTPSAALKQIEPHRLPFEDTLSQRSMTQSERRWLLEHRPAEAVHWRVLTDLIPEHLAYA